MLKTLWARFRTLIAYEPAVVAGALNGGIALLAAYAFGLTATQEAAVATITTALAAIYTAWKARPSDVTVIIGALATIVTAAAAFGFHPPANMIAAGTGLASVILPLILRANLTPAAELKHQEQASGPLIFPGPIH